MDDVTTLNSRLGSFKEASKLHGDPSIYLVGLDCEFISRSNFPESFEKSKEWTKNNKYDASVCVLQIANESSCLILDMTKLGPVLPSTLGDILTSNNWIKMGVGIDLDIKYLSDNFDLGQCSGHMDIKNLAIISGSKFPSLEKVNDAMGFTHLDKTLDSMRDWSKPLTVNQLKYAANDAFASYKIGKKMLHELKRGIGMYFSENICDITPARNIISINSFPKIPNYVGMLQEHSQKNKLDLPKYEELEVSVDKDNIHTFVCQCTYNGAIGIGSGKNKPSAKQNAAMIAYTQAIGQC